MPVYSSYLIINVSGLCIYYTILFIIRLCIFKVFQKVVSQTISATASHITRLLIDLCHLSLQKSIYDICSIMKSTFNIFLRMEAFLPNGTFRMAHQNDFVSLRLKRKSVEFLISVSWNQEFFSSWKNRNIEFLRMK